MLITTGTLSMLVISIDLLVELPALSSVLNSYIPFSSTVKVVLSTSRVSPPGRVIDLMPLALSLASTVIITSWLVAFIVLAVNVSSGATLSMLVIVTVSLVVLPEISVAINSKEPFSSKVCDSLFKVPLLVVAVTSIFSFVGVFT